MRRHDDATDVIERTAHDPDPFVAMCGELVRTNRTGDDTMAHVHTTMPAMERILFLRKVPLFEELNPADLLPIAEVADEQLFADGDRLGVEGEMGDGLHVIVTGSVHVRSGGDPSIAERGPGDVVGELSLITARPRMADLVADGDVRIDSGRRAAPSRGWSSDSAGRRDRRDARARHPAGRARIGASSRLTAVQAVWSTTAALSRLPTCRAGRRAPGSRRHRARLDAPRSEGRLSLPRSLGGPASR